MFAGVIFIMPKKKQTPRKRSPRHGVTPRKQTPKKGNSLQGTPRDGNMAPHSPLATPPRVPQPPFVERLGEIQGVLQNYVDQQAEEGEIPGGMDKDRVHDGQEPGPVPPRKERSHSPIRYRRNDKHGRRNASRSSSSSSDSSSSSSSSSSSCSTCSSSSSERGKKKKKSRSKKSKRERSRRKKKRSNKRGKKHGRRGKRQSRKRKRDSSSSDDEDYGPGPSHPKVRPKPVIGKGKQGTKGKGKAPPPRVQDDERDRDPPRDREPPRRDREMSYDPDYDDIAANKANDFNYYDDYEYNDEYYEDDQGYYQEDSDEEDELDRFTARALTEVNRRANKEQREKLAEERRRASLTLAQILDRTPAPPDATAADVDAEAKKAEPTNTDDPMAKALKIAQEAFDQEVEKGQPINDAYAKIVDGALR